MTVGPVGVHLLAASNYKRWGVFLMSDDESLSQLNSAQAARWGTLTDALMDLIRLLRSFDDRDVQGLSRVQYSLLQKLSRVEDTTMTQTCEELRYDLSVVSRQVSALIDQGLVHRHHDPQDKRAWRISLTQAGRDKLAAARAARIRLFERGLAHHSDDELQAAAVVVASLNSELGAALLRKPSQPTLAVPAPTAPSGRTTS